MHYLKRRTFQLFMEVSLDCDEGVPREEAAHALQEEDQVPNIVPTQAPYHVPACV